MRTSKEIYDRIHWDEGYDARWFAIGYADREHGIIEVPFASFVPDGDIPWHRVQRFRCGNTVVWDRATGVDLVASLRIDPASPDARADAPAPFAGRAALDAHLRTGAVAWVLVREAEGYPGFVEEVTLHTVTDGTARLTVEWRSYAMDWMGDATHVMVIYGFDSLDELLAFVERRYHLGPSDMTPRAPPLPPNTPLANRYPAALVEVFQDAWRRVKADFRGELLIARGPRVVQRFDGF
ncbi:MAG: Endonuclease/exonuclease/phosphatase domain protein [Myxococcaceae bacterium]|nr:Endonuclease/exonuclease/phosphatase domain protein [Myxococcaceae bacterium]